MIKRNTRRGARQFNCQGGGKERLFNPHPPPPLGWGFLGRYPNSSFSQQFWTKRMLTLELEGSAALRAVFLHCLEGRGSWNRSW